ncbi:uncharacterized protein LOC110265645 isoform X2 [Arachis ipaensis]|uniref:uncharacterized protein LOC110265645 isoform X2 n=1 Tax=Arachis ipaensis TaxID=130454 RepID=UPI000A2AF8C2|nr:uncharacterized protein LOC110265645 isoform X2 [Arachis ipaensis]
MRNSDELNFSVGFASALFPLDNFFVSPRCSCRLNCNDEDNDEFRVRKLKLRISCRQDHATAGASQNNREEVDVWSVFVGNMQVERLLARRLDPEAE